MSSKKETADLAHPSFIEAARRAQLIECAIDTIAELGLGQASLAKIAQRAGISTSVISYYFAGKDELLRAVVAHILATGEAFIRARLDLASDARGALLSFIRAFASLFIAHPKNSVAIRNMVFAGRGDLWFPNYPKLESPGQAGFQQILEQGQRDGAFRPFDVRVMAGFIGGALDSIVGRAATEPEFDADAACKELMEVFDRATRSGPS